MIGGPRDGDRKARLAEALRKNLHRRKAQGRARAAREREDAAPERSSEGGETRATEAEDDNDTTAGGT